jgi:quercetin dioxygenase-like cupin family protein
MRPIAALAAVLLTGFALQAQTPALPPGVDVRPLFDNASVSVAQLVLAPGAREMPHAHPYPTLAIITSSGDLEITKAGATSTATRPIGHFEYFDRDVRHAAANVGKAPVEVIAISLKPDRQPGGSAPPMPRPQGITSTDVFDSSALALRRVEFAPGAREVVHTHPYDFMIVAVAQGRIEVHVAGKDEARNYEPGDSLFVGRNVPHSVANVGTERFALLGVTIK